MLITKTTDYSLLPPELIVMIIRFLRTKDFNRFLFINKNFLNFYSQEAPRELLKRAKELKLSPPLEPSLEQLTLLVKKGIEQLKKWHSLDNLQRIAQIAMWAFAKNHRDLFQWIIQKNTTTIHTTDLASPLKNPQQKQTQKLLTALEEIAFNSSLCTIFHESVVESVTQDTDVKIEDLKIPYILSKCFDGNLWYFFNTHFQSYLVACKIFKLPTEERSAWVKTHQAFPTYSLVLKFLYEIANNHKIS